MDDDDNDNDLALEDTLTDMMTCLVCGAEVSFIPSSGLRHVNEPLDQDHAPIVSEVL